MGSVGERLCDGMCAQLRCILVAASKHRPASPQCAHSLHLQGPEWDGGSRGKVSVWDNGLIHVAQTGTAGQLASGKMQLSQECLPHPVQPAGWEALSLTITHAISPTPSMCVFRVSCCRCTRRASAARASWAELCSVQKAMLVTGARGFSPPSVHPSFTPENAI